MELTIRQHLTRIDTRIAALSADLMNSIGRPEANIIEAEIRALRLAETHFKLALQIALNFESKTHAADNVA